MNTPSSTSQARILIGPAGSGKTYRCLAEIRAELRQMPIGPPLVFLAPKQATFQIERQLLEDQTLPGYTRLLIVSFERLAGMVLEEIAGASLRLLSEEGRVMVLRALLARHQRELRIFHATARLPGFARELGTLLRELQEHQITPDKLLRASAQENLPPALRGKLHDSALLFRAYLDWLNAHQLHDPNRLLDLAAEHLRRQNATGPGFQIGGLWMDGFAEMTPQELALLAAIAPGCGGVTLAFCAPAVPSDSIGDFSPWIMVGHTARRCFERLAAVLEQPPLWKILPGPGANGRFTENPALAHLEKHWADPNPTPFSAGDPPIHLIACGNAEAEAAWAAREILRYVHQGGRYRDIAILLRQLDTHAAVLKRVLSRYEIPYFFDQRESVAHHPLAELTRCAVRLAAWNWRHDDWFGALKSGLVPATENELDELENAALENGWEGAAWQQPLRLASPDDPVARLEPLRARLVQPFADMMANLGGTASAPSGAQLADALRGLWDSLRVNETLQTWAEAHRRMDDAPAAVHATVWQAMQEWLDNVALAFGDQSMTLREWLPVLESGLGLLAVGVIPPALDQVLIGAVDRSRNPELQLAILMGMNERVFPAPPPLPLLLAEEERAQLEQHNLCLGVRSRHRLGHERYYGYIACTRSRGRLALTFARSDADGKPVNPSPFVGHLQRLFPNLALEEFTLPLRDVEVRHLSEILPQLLRADDVSEDLLQLAPAPVRQLRARQPDELLSPAMAERLYGKILRTSVSAIERYGQCPFRFFVEKGLGAEERKYYRPDVFQMGSFQHEVLERFHRELEAEGRRWRDLMPEEARARIKTIAVALSSQFAKGLFEAKPSSRFTRAIMTERLAEFAAQAVAWLAACQFDPRAVEVAFGFPDSAIPAWELDLEEGHRLAFRGRIDRLDLCPTAETGKSLCLVVDYKSSAKKLDPVLLEHGIQMQLPAYLSIVRQITELGAALGAGQLVPAGVFYVNLRGRKPGGKGRANALEAAATQRHKTFQHAGRFDRQFLPQLDARPNGEPSGQFNYRIKKDGDLDARSTDPLDSQEFLALMDAVETNLQRMGREIFTGRAAVDPYQKKSEIPCVNCPCQPVCRIDFWTHQFRRLPDKVTTGSGE